MGVLVLKRFRGNVGWILVARVVFVVRIGEEAGIRDGQVVLILLIGLVHRVGGVQMVERRIQLVKLVVAGLVWCLRLLGIAGGSLCRWSSG